MREYKPQKIPLMSIYHRSEWTPAKFQLTPVMSFLYALSTFALLQLAQVFEGRLEAAIDAVTAAQVQEEVTGAERRPRVVNQLPG